MKKYLVEIRGKQLEIIQDEDGKFIKPNFIKEQEQFGTALKPAYEPITVARKPFKGSLVDNVMKHGVGGINIDECRIEYQSEQDKMFATPQGKCTSSMVDGARPDIEGSGRKNFDRPELKGRFPANVILTYDETDFEEVCGGMPYTKGEIGRAGRKTAGNYDASSYKFGVVTDYGFKDEGNASRYFYCAKASTRDRDEGLDEFEEKKMYDGKNAQFGYGNTENDNFGDRVQNVKRKNIHPTVKPTSLMQYLVRLVTPKGGTVLDPFMGSGSTGKAVMFENNDRDANYKFIGIELNEEYCNIAKARIEWAKNEKNR